MNAKILFKASDLGGIGNLSKTTEITHFLTDPGGIIGYANTNIINPNNCNNERDVSAYGVSYSMVGGIVGYCRSASINIV